MAPEPRDPDPSRGFRPVAAALGAGGSVVASGFLAVALHISWPEALLGTLSLLGAWVGAGRLLARRLGCDEPWVALALGMALTSAVAALFTVLPDPGLLAPFLWAVGVPLGVRVLVDHARRPSAVDPARIVELLVFLGGVALALWMVWPGFMVRDGAMTLSGYYLTDGLWFAGSSAELERGLPILNPRMVDTPFVYHYQSLFLGRATAAALGCAHGPALFLVLVPLWLGLVAALGASTLRKLAPDAGAAWWLAAAVATTVLPDIASPLALLTGDLSAAEHFAHGPPHIYLGNHHTVGMFNNVPFASSVASGLAAVRWWIDREGGPERSAVHGVAFLLVAAGLAKGTAVPLCLAAIGLGGLARIRARRPWRDLLWLGLWLGAAQALLSVLLASSIFALQVQPWFLAQYFAFRFPSLATGFEPLDLVTWAALALGWQLFAWFPRAASPHQRELQRGLAVSVVTGVVLANLVAFNIPGGTNELYFSSWMLALTPPWAIRGMYALRQRPLPRVLAAASTGVATIGLVHLLLARTTAPSPSTRTIEADQLEMLHWLRDETPLDATVLNFRYTTLDDEPPQWPPFNEMYFLVSGLAERRVVSEGSKYDGSYMDPRFAPLRKAIFQFYSGALGPAAGREFLARYGIDFVITEPGVNVAPYTELLRPVHRSGRYQVYVVDPRIHGTGP